MRNARRLLPVLLILLGGCMLQESLLYYPDKFSLEQWQATRRDLPPWPAGEAMRGLLAEPKTKVRATAVVFHGNAGHAGHRSWIADELAPLGLRVLLAEYPGYGPRGGKLDEESLVGDAAATLERVRREFGEPILVIGESLGAAVAAGAVARSPDGVDGLMLITPWDRLESVARHHYRWLPVSLFLRDGYDSVAHLRNFSGAGLVVVADSDEIVPARYGRALFEALPGRKRLHSIAGAGHNDWADRVDAAWWATAIDGLLLP